MAVWLRQSTAVNITMGPFVSSTDGVTPQTGMSLTQAETRLSKNGATFAQKNDAGTASHQEEGNYVVALNTTDTDTAGALRVSIYISGALPVWRDFNVVGQNVWDSFFSSDRLQVDVEEIGPNIITASAIATDAIGASELAADAATEIANAVKAAVVETQGSYTLQQALSILLAFAAGQTSNNGATLATPNGGATRITATIDGSNNRTAMTLTPSA